MPSLQVMNKFLSLTFFEVFKNCACMAVDLSNDGMPAASLPGIGIAGNIAGSIAGDGLSMIGALLPDKWRITDWPAVCKFWPILRSS